MAFATVDLRSDTVTRPTPEMRAAIASAVVEDDVIDVDPTVDLLQRRIAEMLGMESALFMPSGTMTNQVAVRIHCKPGDELLCEVDSHLYNYEQGGFAQLSQVVARTIQGDHGVLWPEQFRGMIRHDNEHMVRTRLVSLENTHNRGGGRVLPYEATRDICQWAGEHGLRRHLDGARLFNAVVASGISARDWAKHFDTVSVCFSKGLGAPVGSALVGPRELMNEARRHRKLFGGGMRQAGILAAAALYALEHHVERLAEDHRHARMLAEAVSECPGLHLEPAEVDTNIVIFRVDPSLGSAPGFVTGLEEQGVRTMTFGPDHVRAVTHLDVHREGIERACDRIRGLASDLASKRPVGTAAGAAARPSP
jgi:threonine aldolase